MEEQYILDSKLKDKYLFFLGKLDALKDEIYDAQDEITKEKFEKEGGIFDIVDFAVFDLFSFLTSIKNKKNDYNFDIGYTTSERVYFQELYDIFNSYMPIETRRAIELIENKIKNGHWKEETLGDRFELLISTIFCLANWWDVEDNPHGLYYIMNFDYKYSSKGNYLMPEYIDLLLAFGKDFIAFNKDDYNGIISFIENIRNAWSISVNEHITEIESGLGRY